MSYYYRGPSIDHSLLSPSGKCSKQLRQQAMKREKERLFADVEPVKETEEQRKEREVKAKREHVKRLRELANRGMNTRKYNREADRIEKEINQHREG